ncbi:MAG: endonuclease III [Deltaproteobacteria bacterium]|nr:endonuclease III [Deltaproteobacteria bacterium]
MPKSPSEVRSILKTLHRMYPQARTALRHGDPLELLVATILSAQCTDVRVNEVTKTLFKKYRKAQDYLRVPQEELEADIRPTGFFRNKARSIQGACQKLLSDFGGRVPGTMDELLRLPGVGRKTANCVLGNFFGKAEGIVVDTHVLRISKLVGFTRQKSPEKVERDLMNQIPKEEWIGFSNMLIDHGRAVCKAGRPDCPNCGLRRWCDFGMKAVGA